MQRKLTFSVGEYYHLYNRGVEKRSIFTQKKDWNRFHRLLYLANSVKPFQFREVENKTFDKIDRGNTIVAIGAYVLMPNHFHILVKEIKTNGITSFMEKLTTGYSMYFNKKYERVGALFQGRFKARHIEEDEYLKYLYAYIHLNPIKLIESNWREVGIKDRKTALKYLEQYRYSSYSDYTGTIRGEAAILTKNEYPEHFLENQSFKTYINDWLEYGSIDTDDNTEGRPR